MNSGKPKKKSIKIMQFKAFILVCFSFGSFNAYSVNPLDNSANPFKSEIATEVQILWQTIKNGVTHIAQLENLIQMTDSQLKSAKKMYDNFKVGNVRNANELLREMNKVESIATYTSNLFKYGLLLDDKIEKNLIALKDVANGDDYHHLVKENEILKEKKKMLRKKEIQAFSDNSESRKKRLEKMRYLSEKNNNPTIGAEERKQVTNDLLLEASKTLDEISMLIRRSLVEDFKKENGNSTKLENKTTDKDFRRFFGAENKKQDI